MVYVTADDEVRAVEVPVGLSLMEGAIRDDVPGIIAECGGMCSCATCHVHVEASWRARLEEPGLDELDLLDGLPDRREGSRLSCQIAMTDELDGIVVHVPETQG